MAGGYYIYIFVREDLSMPQRAVQAVHACIELVRAECITIHPAVIICTVKNQDKLLALMDKLTNRLAKKFYEFREPDINNEVTAVAVGPIFGKEREYFKRYQLLK